ncbi:hypothetical protein ZMO02_08050 [Zymomonas mobilis subsp. pomaceae]|nr:hypothetical protein ZMO02_08050 [Zymomonas mobilis subsp. pomaceae]
MDTAAAYSLGKQYTIIPNNENEKATFWYQKAAYSYLKSAKKGRDQRLSCLLGCMKGIRISLKILKSILLVSIR